MISQPGETLDASGGRPYYGPTSIGWGSLGRWTQDVALRLARGYADFDRSHPTLTHPADLITYLQIEG